MTPHGGLVPDVPLAAAEILGYGGDYALTFERGPSDSDTYFDGVLLWAWTPL